MFPSHSGSAEQWRHCHLPVTARKHLACPLHPFLRQAERLAGSQGLQFAKLELDIITSLNVSKNRERVSISGTPLLLLGFQKAEFGSLQ